MSSPLTRQEPAASFLRFPTERIEYYRDVLQPGSLKHRQHNFRRVQSRTFLSSNPETKIRLDMLSGLAQSRVYFYFSGHGCRAGVHGLALPDSSRAQRISSSLIKRMRGAS
jgi:hypothetical protein